MTKQTERTDMPLKDCPLCPCGGMITRSSEKSGDKIIWVVGCDICEVEVSNGNKDICDDIWDNLPRASKTEWASIDSAPRNGVEIYITDGNYVETARWCTRGCVTPSGSDDEAGDNEMGWVTGESSYDECYNTNTDMVPTYWMHTQRCPKPPQGG